MLIMLGTNSIKQNAHYARDKLKLNAHYARDKLKLNAHYARDKLKLTAHYARDKLKLNAHYARDKLKLNAHYDRDKLSLTTTVRSLESSFPIKKNLKENSEKIQGKIPGKKFFFGHTEGIEPLSASAFRAMCIQQISSLPNQDLTFTVSLSYRYMCNWVWSYETVTN